MSDKKFAAGLGFAFVAAWIAFGFGYAVLCLVGAAIFYVAVSFREGDFDLEDLQTRVSQRRSDSSPPSPSRATPRRGSRVQ